MGKYGVSEMNQSKEKPNKTLVDIGILNPKLNNQKIWVRARLHTSRAKGNKDHFKPLNLKIKN